MKLEEGEFLVARVKKHWMALVLPFITGACLYFLIEHAIETAEVK